MRRYIQYIFLSLILCISTVSCIEELDAPQIMQENEELTLVPRVKSFTNQYVTKSAYTGNETKIETLSLLVFDSDGKLVHLHEGSGESVTINKSMLNSTDKKEKLASATVVMFANISIDKICDAEAKSIKDNKEVLTLDDMKNYTCHWDEGKTFVSDLGDNFTGFPMVGGIKGVDLTATGTGQAPIEVPLKILYAKINFSIAVAPGTENEGTTGMNFQLNGYTVNNVSKATVLKDLNIEGEETGTVDESSEATASADYDFTSSAASGTATGTADLNGQTVGFTFYIAESRYNHNSDLKGIYPDDDWLTEKDDEDVKGWSLMSEAEKEKNILNGVKYFYDDLIQQYKPKLAEVDGGMPGKGLATYVTLNGTYTDYRGTVWDVNYKVYLGKDNAHNFHVDRNSAYTNYITIKGIRNNDSYFDNTQSVWVDHRVDVTYNGEGVDDHVTITRETLLDAHIEVRPLRVKWADNDEFDGVRVYLPTDSEGNLIDWIGIERYTGKNNQESSVYCYADGKSTGKRKYFTTDLISELQNNEGEYGVRVDEDTNKKYIYLQNEECAWIYFDENTDSSSDREAKIVLEFYTTSGSTRTVVYNVKQRGLQTIGGYAIESYEEYLHSYDSSDKYDLSTSPVDYTQQGLAWGYDGHKISQNFLVCSAAVPTTALKNQMVKSYSYDFFHESDGSDYNLYTKVSGSWANGSFGTGLDFTDRASANRDIAVKDMGTMPENAYQYCLSKNKFEADDLGSVTMTLNWYLPDPYEMQAILVASQSGNSPVDIDADAFYWSSQPSFSTAGNYINESTDNARAASIQEGISDRPRENQHRIRCVYASNGIDLDEEDMEDRVPDGIGGNYVVYMKAWNNGSIGYFNYLLPEAESRESSTDWVYNTTETNYPNKDNASSISGEKFNYVRTEDKDGNPIEGFNINPGETSSWTEHALGNGYYTTLATYPGLTEFTLTELPLLGGAYQPSTTKKSGTQTVTNKMIKVLDKKLPSATDLRTLDHLTNGSMVNISFDQSKGTTLPAFAYDETVSGTQTTNTKYWIKPEYASTTYEMTGDSQTVKDKGSESVTTQQIYSTENQAKDMAYTGISGSGARPKAEAAAIANLKAKIQTEYPGYTYNESDIKITEISVDYATERGSGWLKLWKATCDVTVEASVTATKEASLALYDQISGTGVWGIPVASSTNLSPAINTDELRMYCGNSFTISLSEEAKQQGYEITKVKVHYLGGNLVDEYGTLNADKAYARFVDSEITLPTESKTVTVIGSTETLQLSGMDYNENQNDGTGTHEWSGSGRESVTLVLSDYLVSTNMSGLNLVYVYQYTNIPRQPGKYIVVDQIEVKCSKRKNATFDFKQIYIDSGSLQTSEWTLKHITFTAEGGTEDAPTAITADGLKLYAGSKVTFKALDGYVINSISGDSDLTFTGSQQTVEFSNLPEKTISNEIIVLYSKLETE